MLSLSNLYYLVANSHSFYSEINHLKKYLFYPDRSDSIQSPGDLS